MAVGIEPLPMPETRLACELLFGHTLDIFNQPAMGCFLLLQYVGERQMLLALRHQRVERIDATVLRRVPWWLATLDDQRQVLQRLGFPHCTCPRIIFPRPFPT